ncbi:C40 family peptidase [Streptomyces sp. NPDC017940]|uniref:C40 family peptidase n=1 Tax=Streptomyces sp. NPDC017940 TaxID=3365017 RepID=UPI00378D34BA
MGKKVWAALGTAAAGVVAVPYLIAGMLTAPVENLDLRNVACALVDMKLGGNGLALSSAQQASASTIISVGTQMRVPVRGQVVAVATAMQESGLLNRDHGHADSVGLFQQRPSMGWGSREQIMDPAYSSRTFYRRLLKVRGWQDMSINDAAQAVQRSGFPTAYAKHEPRAVQVVASASGSSGIQQINANSGCTPLSSPASYDTKGYVSHALRQVGKPYVWGGTGPHGFDCSGLIVYAWRQMGYQLKVRTSQQMYSVSAPVRSGEERSGDLIFTQLQDGGPAHVMIVVRPGLAVEAPRTGLDVRVRKYNAATENMRFGRLPDSQMTALSAKA